MSRRRALVFVLLFLLFVAYGAKVHRKAGDFRNFHHRARCALAGEAVYVDEPYAITYPPFFLLFVAPYAALPFGAAKAAWYATNVLLFLLLFRVSRGLLREEALAGPRRNLLWFLALLAVSRFLLSHFENEQFDFTVALSVLGGLALARAGRDLPAALAIGAGAAAKLTPLLFVVYLFAKRKARLALLAIVVFAVLLVLPDLLIGGSRERPLLAEWYELVLVRVTPWSGGSPWAAGGKIWAPGGILNQSLSATMLRFLSETGVRIKGASGIPESVSVNFLSLPPETVKRASYALAALLLLPLLFLALRRWSETPGRDLVRETALVTTLMLLLSPQTSKPHLVILLPAYALLAADALGPRKDRVSAVLFLLSFAAATLTVDGLVGRHFGDLFQALGAVTIGVLFLYAGLLRLSLRDRAGALPGPAALG
ncbi:MAG: DUF2029 domain-containing protein [Candidatus Latescibacterota bacterium]|nr:MAG: DUF2029 domain-containing protein [Candidatus Latescibacterota bacterium]